MGTRLPEVQCLAKSRDRLNSRLFAYMAADTNGFYATRPSIAPSILTIEDTKRLGFVRQGFRVRDD